METERHRREETQAFSPGHLNAAQTLSLNTNIAAADDQQTTHKGYRNTNNKPHNQQTKKDNQNHIHWKNPMQSAVKSENNTHF